MKASFAALSLLAALAAADPAASDANIKRGLELVAREDSCHKCIDNCEKIGGVADAACKATVCAVQARLPTLMMCISVLVY